MSGRHLAFPFRISADGRPATPASLGEHIKGELIQLLLTNPGERPFLPGFGGGLRRLVFEGGDEVTAGVAKAAISHDLRQWLGNRIEVITLDVDREQAAWSITVQYRIQATGEQQSLRFEHEA